MSMVASHAKSTELPPASATIDWDDQLRRHDRWLRAVVAARVGERQAVEEVMQEVALAAVKQQAPIQDPTKVAPWLYRLAVRQALLYRRKMGRRRKLARRYAEHVATQPKSEDDPLRWLLNRERRRLVRQALDCLARKDREILLLKYAQNWKYQQIADHLGISFSAAQTRLHRARERLRDALLYLEETGKNDQ